MMSISDLYAIKYKVAEEISGKYGIQTCDIQDLLYEIASNVSNKMEDTFSVADSFNINQRVIVFQFEVFEQFLQDNPDFSYDDLCACTIDKIDLSAFYQAEDRSSDMRSMFGSQSQFEKEILNGFHDLYFYLIDNDDSDESELGLEFVLVAL